MQGVYEIYCIKSGKRYIGSSKDINARWKSHISALRKGNHHNYRLQKAFISYAESDFIFTVLEIVDDPNKLFEVEEKYIKKFKFGRLYNALKKPGEVPKYRSRWMQRQQPAQKKAPKDEWAFGE